MADPRFLSGDVDTNAVLLDRYLTLLDILERDPATLEDEHEEHQPSVVPEGADAWLRELEADLRLFIRSHLVIATPRLDKIFGNPNRGGVVPELFRIIECHSETLPSAPKSGFLASSLRHYSRLRRWSPRIDLWWTAAGRSLQPASNPPLWMQKIRVDDVTIEIEIEHLEARSVHIFVNAPPGTYVDRRIFAVASAPRSGHGFSLTQVDDDDVHWNAAHFSWSNRQLPVPSTILDSRVLLVLRPTYHGLMRAPTVLTGLTTFVLGVLTMTTGWTSAQFPGSGSIPIHSNETASEPETVILLGILTIALGVLIRTDEHMMTRKVANKFRTRLAGVLMMTLLTALAIAVGLTGPWLFGVFAVAFFGAFSLFLGIVRMARFSWKRGDTKPTSTLPPPGKYPWWVEQ
jgi:hypothetical protein